MPAMTAKGSWKGQRAQIANVSKALQSVRSLARLGHVEFFGDGDDGCANYIVNKIAGGFTAVKDDSVNCLLGLHIAPRHEAGFCQAGVTSHSFVRPAYTTQVDGDFVAAAKAGGLYGVDVEEGNKNLDLEQGEFKGLEGVVPTAESHPT